jgi:hypothetical protein
MRKSEIEPVTNRSGEVCMSLMLFLVYPRTEGAGEIAVRSEERTRLRALTTFKQELLSALLATLLWGGLVVAPGIAADELTIEPLLDAQGRQLIPGGYVVIESVKYAPSDYRRMVRMGANFQVIRVPLGKIGGWKGVPSDPSYLEQVDTLVRMGKDVEIKTILKLVVYGIRPFGDEQWNRIWHNTDDTQETLMAAWSKIWMRYKGEPAVFGYDLLNEPQRGLDRDYDRCQREQLLPLLRRLTDTMHETSSMHVALVASRHGSAARASLFPFPVRRTG